MIERQRELRRRRHRRQKMKRLRARLAEAKSTEAKRELLEKMLRVAPHLRKELEPRLAAL